MTPEGMSVTAPPDEPEIPFFDDLVKQAMKKFPGGEVHESGDVAAPGRISVPFAQLTSEIQRLAETGLVRIKGSDAAVLVTEPIRELLEKHPNATIHVPAPPTARGVPLGEALKK